jgi:hypothetical protein
VSRERQRLPLPLKWGEITGATKNGKFVLPTHRLELPPELGRRGLGRYRSFVHGL